MDMSILVNKSTFFIMFVKISLLPSDTDINLMLYNVDRHFFAY